MQCFNELQAGGEEGGGGVVKTYTNKACYRYQAHSGP